MIGRRQSTRKKHIPKRFVGWYGLRMVTASRDKTFMKPQAESKSVVGDTMIQSPDHIVLPAAEKSVDVNDQPADDPPGQSIGLHVDDQSNVDVHDQPADDPPGQCIDFGTDHQSSVDIANQHADDPSCSRCLITL